jgi:hypothetical protein
MARGGDWPAGAVHSDFRRPRWAASEPIVSRLCIKLIDINSGRELLSKRPGCRECVRDA